METKVLPPLSGLISSSHDEEKLENSELNPNNALQIDEEKPVSVTIDQSSPSALYKMLGILSLLLIVTSIIMIRKK